MRFNNFPTNDERAVKVSLQLATSEAAKPNIPSVSFAVVFSWQAL